jgi:oxygen-independent coproporphyrinogen III oxidase
MSGIYIHIPFCKMVCFYCDFHFTVSLKQKDRLINAILKEVGFRKNYLAKNDIETIYFGGGTPSILDINDIAKILSQIYNYFSIAQEAEITLEANPDDLNKSYLQELKNIGINRLSIGVQSFFDEELKWMNRRHTSQEAEHSIKLSQDCGFSNLNVDLIYGIPGLTDKRWKQNLDLFLRMDVPHLSAYHLTIEPKTVFGYYKRKGRLTEISENDSISHYEMLINTMELHKYHHYEISNFSLNGFMSRHNTNYWNSGKYLGIGPSAHSFNGTSRQWNSSVNTKYMNGLEKNESFYEIEMLSETDRFNDYLLTGLRTAKGVNKEEILKIFGNKYLEHFERELKKFNAFGYVLEENSQIRLTEIAMFVSDKIISELFWV